jgi:uncharacterized membrane protein YidH (DUF202 family)
VPAEAAAGCEYATALARERAFLVRQGMTLGLLASAVAAQCLFATCLGCVLSVILAAIAILASAMDVIRWRRIANQVGDNR